MTDRPILFSGPMVRAILAGTKTETRRICKQAVDEGGVSAGSVHPTGLGRSWIAWWPFATAEETVRLYPGNEGFRCPYGVPSDRLWVRETWKATASDEEAEHVRLVYAADGRPTWRNFTGERNGLDERVAWCDRWLLRGMGAWQPSIYMPRWASRLTLAVESVRVERLHDIGDAGARAEGVADREAYRALWSEINGAKSWDANPWVWVVQFARVQP
jgi:hypothetical protein